MRLLAAMLAAVISGPLAAQELPDDSVYHAGSTWTTQDNRTLGLAELRGTVQVVSFVYTYCEHSCPTIIARLKAIDGRIPAADRPNVAFTLISLDPGRDTPDVMKAYMQDKRLDERRYTMLHGDPDDVREFSAMLGVRYRPMGASDIAHSNMITVLDVDGVIRYQMKGLSEDPEGTVAAIADAVATNVAP